jgi:hypothetical protein
MPKRTIDVTLRVALSTIDEDGQVLPDQQPSIIEVKKTFDLIAKGLLRDEVQDLCLENSDVMTLIEGAELIGWEDVVHA